MSTRALQAWIDTRHVGELQDTDGLWAFQYTAQWLASPYRFALSPHLPLQDAPLLDGATVRPVQWYFDNLLPEENQRNLLATDARVDAADAFGLLAFYGAESAGSLTLLPPGQGGQAAVGLRPLSDEALSERIKTMPKVPLTHGAVKRMSLAGAQHKLPVVLDNGALFEPVGSQSSTHILKPNHLDEDYPNTVINEWFIMQLAHKIGLETPQVHRRYVPQSVYLIDRFDRQKDQGAWRRIHQIDACQLLGLNREFKYTLGSIESLRAMAEACRSPSVTSARLFSWLVFNVLTGNADAHLKNLSFLVSSEGVKLSPHYDLLSAGVYESRAFNKTSWPKESQLAWPILDARRFSEVTRGVMIDAAHNLGISKATATRLMDSQVQRMPQAARDIQGKMEAENAALAANRSQLAATLGGEARTVRSIIYGAINDMCVQLARDP